MVCYMSDEKELKYKLKYRISVNDKFRYCSALCSSYEDVMSHANDMIRMYGKDFEMIYLKEILELAPYFINDFYKNKIDFDPNSISYHAGRPIIYKDNKDKSAVSSNSSDEDKSGGLKFKCYTESWTGCTDPIKCFHEHSYD